MKAPLAVAADLGLDEITIDRLHARYLGGELTAVQVVTEYLRRIAQARSEPGQGGIVATNPRAVEAAEALDEQLRTRGVLAGPLHGVPIVIKDQFETVDLPTSFGSRAVTPRLASADAPVIARLRAAGAIVLATAAMADFGLSLFSRSSRSGPLANPYDRRRDIGGSSSGCAQAVAANLCVAAIGMDSSGSVRLPASFAGLVGLRPTTGTVPTVGASPVLPMQDVPGPMTRTVRDAELVHAVMHDSGSPVRGPALPLHGPGSVRRSGLTGVRIGVLRLPGRAGVDLEAMQVEQLIADAVVALSRMGATVAHLTLPTLRPHRRVAAAPVIRRQLQEYFAARPEFGIRTLSGLAADDGADLLALLTGGLADACAVTALLDDRARRRAQLVRTMHRHDVQALCYPTSALPAPRTSDLDSGRWTSLNFPALTWLAARAGAPAVTVPAGYTQGGLPVGLEFLGLPYGDDLVLSIASAFEAATPPRRPPIVR